MIGVEAMEVFVEHGLILEEAIQNRLLSFEEGGWGRLGYFFPLIFVELVAELCFDHEYFPDFFFHYYVLESGFRKLFISHLNISSE